MKILNLKDQADLSAKLHYQESTEVFMVSLHSGFWLRIFGRDLRGDLQMEDSKLERSSNTFEHQQRISEITQRLKEGMRWQLKR